MEFNEHKPIYLQIADNLCDRILREEWKEEERIPSVRELGMELGVNPNTIMRTYDFLQTSEVIYNKRGIGYFVASNAKENVRASLKLQFVENELSQVFKKMELLGITIDEVTDLCRKYSSK